MNDSDTISRYSHSVTALLLIAAAALLFFGHGISGTALAASAEDTGTVTGKQEPGKITYWVLPGPRVLSENVFGTPDDPTATFKPKLKAASQAAGPPTVPDLLKKVPFLVGVPVKVRDVTENGTYIFKQPTPFSDKGRIIAGHFTATFNDVVNENPPGKPGKTPDSAEFEATFEDPQGNEYRVVLDHVVKPPFPGYDTGGGVMIDAVHHGGTGTGTPLMPTVKTYAALWGVGTLHVNGEKVDDHRVMHVMTTEVVRNKDYKLVHTDDLPLAPAQRFIRDQEHHTHLMMPPVKGTKKGPVFSPVPTAFKLPNGKRQPFIHVMFEQDEIQGI